jgi:hypothetical protein
MDAVESVHLLFDEEAAEEAELEAGLAGLPVYRYAGTGDAAPTFAEVAVKERPHFRRAGAGGSAFIPCYLSRAQVTSYILDQPALIVHFKSLTNPKSVVGFGIFKRSVSRQQSCPVLAQPLEGCNMQIASCQAEIDSLALFLVKWAGFGHQSEANYLES